MLITSERKLKITQEMLTAKQDELIRHEIDERFLQRMVLEEPHLKEKLGEKQNAIKVCKKAIALLEDIEAEELDKIEKGKKPFNHLQR